MVPEGEPVHKHGERKEDNFVKICVPTVRPDGRKNPQNQQRAILYPDALSHGIFRLAEQTRGKGIAQDADQRTFPLLLRGEKTSSRDGVSCGFPESRR